MQNHQYLIYNQVHDQCFQADLDCGLRGLCQRAQRRPGPHDDRPHRHRGPGAGRQPPLGRGLVCVSILISLSTSKSKMIIVSLYKNRLDADKKNFFIL